jgi:hypothetical protein
MVKNNQVFCKGTDEVFLALSSIAGSIRPLSSSEQRVNTCPISSSDSQTVMLAILWHLESMKSTENVDDASLVSFPYLISAPFSASTCRDGAHAL